MTKKRQFEIKITNQVLAAFVVILSLGLGYFIAKEQGWLKDKYPDPNISTRSYIDGEYILNTSRYYSLPVERIISQRRTRRQFQTTAITLNELSKLTWSLQGITADWGGRVAPTIKSSYPLEISIITRNVEEVEQGIYHYIPEEKTIKKTLSSIPEYINKMGDKTPSIIDAPVIFIISGNQSIVESVTKTEFPQNLLYLEAGHIAQNLFLMAESLNLGVNPISQFDEIPFQSSLSIPQEETVLYILPVGHPLEI